MSRLSILDYLQRGVVYTCAALSVWGVGMGVAIHRDTLRRGREIIAQREAMGLSLEPPEKTVTEEQREQSLAELAQAALPSRKPPQKS
ncbi:hypothetical protein FA15DRAFT_616119 [Coprinopsis marcescibilis]|uniref:Uncharacterized protein n=1 Tax=Coprinopsis marcescibilis TaxID=230819 RepID=A0A5C3L2B7_COPMA|nr:hypothetical protein FA15DRAFT_616119 [Coprinopsis marcescibilis]